MQDRGDDWLQTTADDVVIVCRARRHDFPVIIPGRSIPRGIRAEPIGQGCVEITYPCKRGCGTSRREVTAPGGLMDEDALMRYEYDKERYTSPPGSRLTSRDARREQSRRTAEMVLALAGIQSAIPPAKFSTGA